MPHLGHKSHFHMYLPLHTAFIPLYLHSEIEKSRFEAAFQEDKYRI